MYKKKVDKWMDVSKQAKSVLRVPRLCTLYHGKVKGLTETEQNQVLETIYNDWYVAAREQKAAEMRKKTEGSTTNNSIDKTQQSDLRELSKIEETLMDRSVQRSIT